MELFGMQQHEEEIRKSKAFSGLALTCGLNIVFWCGSRGSAWSKTQDEA